MRQEKCSGQTFSVNPCGFASFPEGRAFIYLPVSTAAPLGKGGIAQ